MTTHLDTLVLLHGLNPLYRVSKWWNQKFGMSMCSTLTIIHWPCLYLSTAQIGQNAVNKKSATAKLATSTSVTEYTTVYNCRTSWNRHVPNLFSCSFSVCQILLVSFLAHLWLPKLLKDFKQKRLFFDFSCFDLDHKLWSYKILKS